MSELHTSLLALATWDTAARTPMTDEDAAAASVLRELVVEHYRSDGKEAAPFPLLAMELIGTGARRDWDVAPLAALIGKDPVIAARVIRAANSAYSAGVREVETLRDAVVRLGTRAAAGVAVTAATRALFDGEARAIQRTFRSSWERLWQHAVRTAAGARWLARQLGQGDPERAFLGGLLHDVGKTFALRSLAALVVEEQIRASVEERIAWELVDAAHVEVGTELAVFWNFPEYLTSVCMMHHAGAASPLPEVELVRLVSAVDDVVFDPWHRAGLDADLEQACAALGVQPETVIELAGTLGELGAQASAGL